MPLQVRRCVVAFVLAVAATTAAAQADRRLVRLEVFPTKDAKPVPIAVRENETLITTIKELGTLAFEVRFRDKQEKIVLVVIFEAETKPHVLLGALELPTDGKRVETSTSPPFEIRVRRIESAR